MKYLLLTVLVVLFGYFHISSILDDRFIVGNELVEVVVGEGIDISIDGDFKPVTIIAASPDFFIVRNTADSDSEKLLIGAQAEKPVGWKGQYFKSDTVTIDALAWNAWRVEKGTNITLRVESEGVMKVSLYLTESAKASILGLWMVIYFLVWVVGCVIIS